MLLGRNAYTALGFIGYVVATIVAASLAIAWGLSLGERLVAMLAPPLGFLVVATIATAIKGREWIVFYQAVAGAVAATVAAGLMIEANVPRLLDTTAISVGTFLLLGRIGCFRVGCCHGRPARCGVVYDERHVALGLWPACAHRPLVPVQLIEAAGSASLVVLALLTAVEPGRAACTYAVGYALMRFALEHLRGDPARPVLLGVSEARWWCLGTAAACTVVSPAWWTVAAAAILSAATIATVAVHRRAALLELRHVRALDEVCAQVLADPDHARRETTRGIAVSCHSLPDGRLDWVWSSAHPTWSVEIAAALAGRLWTDAEVIAGRTPGVVHVVVGAPEPRGHEDRR